MYRITLLLLLLGLMTSAQRSTWGRYNSQPDSREEHKQKEQRQNNNRRYEHVGNQDPARALYFMDDLAQRVQYLPANTRIVVPPASARVLLNLQLVSYKDPNRALPGNQFCYYNPPNSNNQPSGNNNTISGNTGPAVQNCRFMFTALIVAPLNSMQVYTSGPIQLAQDGSANLSLYVPWKSQQTLGFTLKPMSIQILVHHYGNVADKNGNLRTYGALVHVDSFVLSLLTVTPAAYGVNFNNHYATLTGLPGGLRTSLQLKYGLRCNIRGQLGNDCDLICNPSTGSNSGKQVCNSTVTGRGYICQGNNTFGSNAGQVTNCSYCQYGTSSYGACLHAPNVYTSRSSSGVAYGYYIATIVLAVVAGILLIVLLAAILLWCWGNTNEDDRDDRRREWSFRNRNRPDIVKTSKSSPPLGQGYHPVSTQPDPEWQPGRTQAGMQRTSVSDSQNSSARPAPYYDQPGDRQIPPLAVAEPTGSRASQASSNASYPNPTGPRREAAV